MRARARGRARERVPAGASASARTHHHNCLFPVCVCAARQLSLSPSRGIIKSTNVMMCHSVNVYTYLHVRDRRLIFFFIGIGESSVLSQPVFVLRSPVRFHGSSLSSLRVHYARLAVLSTVASSPHRLPRRKQL